jgi:hypothetical protein
MTSPIVWHTQAPPGQQIGVVTPLKHSLLPDVVAKNHIFEG